MNTKSSLWCISCVLLRILNYFTKTVALAVVEQLLKRKRVKILLATNDKLQRLVRGFYCNFLTLYKTDW